MACPALPTAEVWLPGNVAASLVAGSIQLLWIKATRENTHMYCTVGHQNMTRRAQLLVSEGGDGRFQAQGL